MAKIGIAGVGTAGTLHLEILLKKDVQIVLADPRLHHRETEIRLAAGDNDRKIEAIYYEYGRLGLCGCDAVIIATPDFLHGPAIKNLAGRVRYFLIEKPLGSNFGMATEIANDLQHHGSFGMCGLTGLYHPPFYSLFHALQEPDKCRRPIRVNERLFEAGPALGKYTKDGRGVFTCQGVHSLHRFRKIASLFGSERPSFTNITATMKTEQFPGHTGEDMATFRAQSERIDFELELGFYNAPNCPGTGRSHDYKTIVECDDGSKIVTEGWKGCYEFASGATTPTRTHFEYRQDMPFRDRIKVGLEAELDAFLAWIKTQAKSNHPTLHEAISVQDIIERCYSISSK